jgi:hypothetical protein
MAPVATLGCFGRENNRPALHPLDCTEMQGWEVPGMENQRCT